MRLPVDARSGFLVLGLSLALSGCGLIGGVGDRPAALVASEPAASGPAADYPVVLGDPFTIDGGLYTPADTANYDAVGYAGTDAGAGVTAAHRTLPLPSYVEVTSLESGKTILVRVERRGPMEGSRLMGLSPAAAAQLGGAEGTPVRVRRVNPPEAARADLRAGLAAPEPIATPKSLLAVLLRKLPASGAASLGAPALARMTALQPEKPRDVSPVASAPQPVVPALANAGAAPGTVTVYPLSALVSPPAAPVASAAPAPTVFTIPPRTPVIAAQTAPIRKIVAAALPGPKGGFVVQAGTFSVRANAQKVADTLGGHVAPVGKFYRVRMGPFANRGQAEAALAKVRAAGYSDARVYTAG
jgi:rare lipoprotein A